MFVNGSINDTESWSKQRRVVARIDATTMGLDIRYVATNLTCLTPRVI